MDMYKLSYISYKNYFLQICTYIHGKRKEKPFFYADMSAPSSSHIGWTADS